MSKIGTVLAMTVAAVALGAGLTPSRPARAETVITLGVGTQDTTTNTVTAGTIIRELHLLDKYLPKTGKYAGAKIQVEWQNFTSGPPVTNGMMANKIQIGTMGDYPLVVNGFTFQSNPDSKSWLVAVDAYNMSGSGNGVVVNKDTPYYELADLKGKTVSVPFGSAAHGMLLKAMQDRGWKEDFWNLVSQSPEVGSTNLQEKKIDAHADFVPFPELLPHRGFGRKIYDGVENNVPTWHGIVVRSDFAEKYPEIVTAYLKAMLEANAWVRADPQRAAEKVAQWTGIDKEVVYIFLGPGGIMTVDPTLKPALLQAAAADVKVLQNMNRIQAFDPVAWAHDQYLRQAFAESGLDYDKQLAGTANYEIAGHDDFCNKPIDEPRKAGEIWVTGEPIHAYSSTRCTLSAYVDLQRKGKPIDVAYLFDAAHGTKLFADQAYYALAPEAAGGEVVPFLLKKDAQAYAAKVGGRMVDLAEALAIVGVRS